MTAAPAPPDPNTATVEDWKEYQGVYAGWVESASDAELLAEMAALPVEGQAFTPSEAWRYHQCELRRRTPPKDTRRRGRGRAGDDDN